MALTGEVAGDLRFGMTRITAWLFEGDMTPTSVFSRTGLKREDQVAIEKEIVEGELVEFFDSVELTYAATGGLPVVQKISGSGAKYVARVIEIHPYEDCPASPMTDLGLMLAGKNLRKATIEPLGMVGMFTAEVTVEDDDPALKVEVGVPEGVIWDEATGKFMYGSGTSTQLVPLHHIAGSTSVDVVAPVLMGVGMQTIEVVS